MTSVEGPLTTEQVSQWRERGYVVVPGLIESQLVQSCTDIMHEIFKNSASKDFGSDGKCEFPTATDLDDVTVHENLIDAVCQLLDTPDILLTQR